MTVLPGQAERLRMIKCQNHCCKRVLIGLILAKRRKFVIIPELVTYVIITAHEIRTKSNLTVKSASLLTSVGNNLKHRCDSKIIYSAPVNLKSALSGVSFRLYTIVAIRK